MPYLLRHFKAPAIRSTNPDIATHLSLRNVRFSLEYSWKRKEIQLRVRCVPEERSRVGKLGSSVKCLFVGGLGITMIS
jgi:hypothetical protein